MQRDLYVLQNVCCTAKLNRSIVIKQPNVQLLDKCPKEIAVDVSFQLKARELEENGTKIRKKYVNFDKGLENILAEFSRTNNLKKCLEARSYITKFE